MSGLTPGARLRSVAGTPEVVVVRPPASDLVVQHAGRPMLAVGTAEPPLADVGDLQGETALGKRYVHEESGLELLCVKAGPGALSVNGVELDLKAPKPLPASD